MSSWLVCGSKASNHSLWFGGEEGADEPPSSQLVQEKACPRLALLQKGLWDASLQIKSLPPSIYISSFNLNRLSYSLGSSIHVCLDSSHGPHFFTVPEQLEDQTCPLTLAIAIGQCTKASQVVRSFLFPCLFSSLSLKKKKKALLLSLCSNWFISTVFPFHYPPFSKNMNTHILVKYALRYKPLKHRILT